MTPSFFNVLPSNVTFYGTDETDILYSSDQNNGIVTHNIIEDYGNWTLYLHDALWNDYTIFKRFLNNISKPS